MLFKHLTDQWNTQRRTERSTVLIVGCGQLGTILAERLSRDGYAVVVIDRSAEAFRQLGPGYGGHTICGDASNLDILRDAGVESAQLFIAATRTDTLNIMLGIAARRVFKVQTVIVRIDDPSLEAAITEEAITVIDPVRIAADLLLQTMLGVQHDAAEARS